MVVTRRSTLVHQPASVIARHQAKLIIGQSCGRCSVKVLHQHQVSAFFVELGVKDPAIVWRNGQTTTSLNRRNLPDLTGCKVEKVQGATSWLGVGNEVHTVVNNVETPRSTGVD